MKKPKPVDTSLEHKIGLAEENVRLGQHRLYAALIQAGLTVLNLFISVLILIHILGVM